MFVITVLFFSCQKQQDEELDVLNQLQAENISVEDLPETITFWSDYPAEVLARALVQRMSDSELLAQIFMFGWAGLEPSPLLNQWVLDRGLGSVKVLAGTQMTLT